LFNDDDYKTFGPLGSAAFLDRLEGTGWMNSTREEGRPAANLPQYTMTSNVLPDYFRIVNNYRPPPSAIPRLRVNQQ
jgi:hypothetical protein